jgi:phospholipase C
MTRRRFGPVVGVPIVGVALLLASCFEAGVPARLRPARPSPAISPLRAHPGLAKLRHLVFVIQENRSFDHYFGTFPGADGLPRVNGRFTVCVPDPKSGRCQYPYHDPHLVNAGGPHSEVNSAGDVNHGRMNGFIQEELTGDLALCRRVPTDPMCTGQTGRGNPDASPDVMGYHDAREIPNYWAYARNFVLQDRLFESAFSWSLPSHLFTVSGWSATCADSHDPMSCRSDLGEAGGESARHSAAEPAPFGWTDITYLLHRAGVSWRYYYAPKTPHIWNPLPRFQTVRQNHQMGNIEPIGQFYDAARAGRLPAVSWVVPNWQYSEHPPASIRLGQAFVTRAVMKGPDWTSSAVFVTWDDWGGFYDHVVPPQVDENGYGLRVPGLMISPYAKAGFIDHQTLSFDAYLKLIEDRFLGGRRLDPRTDGRPDSRPTVRETLPILGDLVKEFDFSKPPRPPFVLPVFPSPGPASRPRGA